MEAMNCRAAGISSRDLAGGIDLLRELDASSEGMRWLSMNIVGREDSEPLFAPFITQRVGETTIAILGLTNDKISLHSNDYTIKPWQDALADVVKKAEKQSDMVILLSSYPDAINEQIARKAAGLDLIFSSGHRPVNQIPKVINNTLLAKTSDRGKYLGVLRINWTGTGIWGQDFMIRVRAEQNRLDRVNWQMGRMEKRIDPDKLKEEKRYQKLLISKEEITAQIHSLKEEKTNKLTNEPSSFNNQFIALKSSVPQNKQVQKIVDQTTQTVNELNRKKVRSSPKKQSALNSMAGWKKCAECHQDQTAFWQNTSHAKAFKTLEKVNQQFNEECLVCHVTLPWYEPKRVRAEKLLHQLPEKLNNVGCESCHGPSMAHSNDPENTLPAQPTEATCTGCHNSEHDDNLVFSEKVERIRCPDSDI